MNISKQETQLLQKASFFLLYFYCIFTVGIFIL